MAALPPYSYRTARLLRSMKRPETACSGDSNMDHERGSSVCGRLSFVSPIGDACTLESRSHDEMLRELLEWPTERPSLKAVDSDRTAPPRWIAAPREKYRASIRSIPRIVETAGPWWTWSSAKRMMLQSSERNTRIAC